MEKQLWFACGDGNIEKVQELLQNEQININWQDNRDSTTPFHIACQNGHIEIVKLLLNDKRIIDINVLDKTDKTPLSVACWNGHVEVVKLLLNDNRIDINKKVNMVLHLFMELVIVDILKL